MGAEDRHRRTETTGVQEPPRRFGVLVFPVERERRLYFLVTLVLTCWYLLDRLL